jgi:hypothetical protein
MTTTTDLPQAYAAALERLARINAEALDLAEVLDHFAGVLRGARLGPDGPPLEALPSSARVRRLVERQAILCPRKSCGGASGLVSACAWRLGELLVPRTSPTEGRRMTKTFIDDLRRGPGPLRDSVYDSTLEVPDGRDPNQNAWLTITLKVNLQFADANQLYGIVRTRDGVGFVEDSDKREYRVRNWDSPSKTQCTSAFFVAGQKYWNRRFTLITPQDYDELDFTSRVSPGWHVRPNVLCLFRLVPEPDANQAHRNIKVVRLNTTIGEDLRDLLWGRPANGVSFRSHWELYQWVDVYNNTLFHELGHALGQDHILALQGDVKC